MLNFRVYVVVPRQKIPTSPAAIVTETCELVEMYVANNGTATATINIYDGSSGYLIPGMALPPGSVLSVNSALGVQMLGGINWSSTTDNVWATIKGGIH